MSLLNQCHYNSICPLCSRKMHAKTFNWENSAFWQSSSENARLGQYNAHQEHIFDWFVLKFDTWIPWTMIHTPIIKFSSSVVFLGGFKVWKTNIFMLPTMSSSIIDSIWHWLQSCYIYGYPLTNTITFSTSSCLLNAWLVCSFLQSIKIMSLTFMLPSMTTHNQ